MAQENAFRDRMLTAIQKASEAIESGDFEAVAAWHRQVEVLTPLVRSEEVVQISGSTDGPAVEVDSLPIPVDSASLGNAQGSRQRRRPGRP